MQGQDGSPRVDEGIKRMKDSEKAAAGIGHLKAGEFAQAAGLAQEILQKNRKHPTALMILGYCSHAQGRWQEAIDFYQRSLKTKPGDLNVMMGLGKVQKFIGDYASAAKTFKSITKKAKGNDEAQAWLAEALHAISEYGQAGQAADKAIRTNPQNALAYLVKARLAKDGGGKVDEAIGYCRKAILADPKHIQAHNELANFLYDSGDAAAACEAYQTILGQTGQETNLIYSSWLFSLHNVPGITREEIFRHHLNWQVRHKAPGKGNRKDFPNPPVPGRKIRVGFTSPDFHTHSVFYFTAPLFANFDRGQFTFVCFSDLQESKEDAQTQLIQNHVDEWYRVNGLGMDALHAFIQQKQVDILVDLTGHTGKNRLPVFDKRAAPVQVTWLGYPDTTGLDTMDYRIVDAVTDPEPWADKLSTETLFRLPSPFLCYQPDPNWGDIPCNPSTTPGKIVFGSFNDAPKLTPETVNLWCEILRRVPSSSLLVKCRPFSKEKTMGYLEGKFRENGIGTNRLAVIDYVPTKDGHLTTYNQVDIALDPFPYNGTTTTCEAMWMGVPLVTMEGDRHCARVGMTLLEAVGLQHLIAKTPEEYIQIAVDLAQNPQELEATKRGLRDKMLRSPLCDGKTFAGKFGVALREMWTQWCKDKADNQTVQPLEQMPVQPSPQVAGSPLANASKLLSEGKIQQAREIGEKLLARAPQNPDALLLMGNISKRMGRTTEAIQFYQKCLETQPNLLEARLKLGQSYARANNFKDALGNFQAAIKLAPGNIEALAGLAEAFYELDVLDMAEQAAVFTIKHDPNHAFAYVILAGINEKKKEPVDKAIALCIKAVEYDPKCVRAYQSLGNYLVEAGDPAAACTQYRKILDMTGPETAHIHSNWLLTLHYRDDISRDELFQSHLEWKERHKLPNRRKKLDFPNQPNPGRKLKVGFTSPDLHSHAVYFFLNSLFSAYDRGQFEFICFSDHPEFREDPFSDELRGQVDKWHRVHTYGSGALEELINKEKVDILIDLSGHTGNNRIFHYLKRCAPVQVTWLGYPDTTGLDSMDYRIVDPVSDPEPWADQFATEKLYRIPAPFLCYKPHQAWYDLETTRGLLPGKIRFGSFNTAPKLSPSTIRLWCRILQNIPEAELVIKCRPYGREKTQAFIRQALQQYGVAPSRLRMLEFSDTNSGHMQTYHEMDIALDPFPYNGTTTTFDALWMGVPVITLEGDRHCGRVGTTLMTAMGMERWVAKTEEEYIQIAIEASRNRQQLDTLKKGLRQRMLLSPLCDSSAFAKKFGAALRDMWGNWCEEKKGKARPKVKPSPPPINADEQLVSEAYKLLDNGELQKATVLGEQILKQNPSNHNALMLLGDIFMCEGNLPQAIAHYQQCVEAKPDATQAMLNMAKALASCGKHLDALEAYQAYLKLIPDSAEALEGMAEAFYTLGLLDKAETALGFALRYNSGSSTAHMLYAKISRDKGDPLAKAAAHCEKALACDPDRTSHYIQYGNMLARAGDPAQACKIFKRPLGKQSPLLPLIHSNLLMAMHYLDDVSRETLFREHLDWNTSYNRSQPRKQYTFTNQQDPTKKLKVGFISADFRKHAVFYFLNSLFSDFSRDNFTFIGFSDLEESNEDEFTQNLKGHLDGWHNIKRLNADAMDSLLTSQQLDILVELGGHTGSNRLQCLSRRCAPVQVTWLGYPDTTGLDEMDFRIVDGITDPPNWADSLASETLLRIPAPFLCYKPPPEWEAIPTRHELQHGKIRLGSFNAAPKLNQSVIQLWCSIIKAIPESELVLKCLPGCKELLQASVIKSYQALDLDRNRLRILPFDESTPGHMTAYNEIDIALDPFPYNGTTTSFEALWMGVPLITLEGDRHCARVGMSLMESMGMRDWIARDQDDYIQIAIKASQDRQHLQRTKEGLRRKMQASPLCDSQAFAQKFCQALRAMWQQWCSGAK